MMQAQRMLGIKKEAKLRPSIYLSASKVHDGLVNNLVRETVTNVSDSCQAQPGEITPYVNFVSHEQSISVVSNSYISLSSAANSCDVGHNLDKELNGNSHMGIGMKGCIGACGPNSKLEMFCRNIASKEALLMTAELTDGTVPIMTMGLLEDESGALRAPTAPDVEEISDPAQRDELNEVIRVDMESRKASLESARDMNRPQYCKDIGRLVESQVNEVAESASVSGDSCLVQRFSNISSDRAVISEEGYKDASSVPCEAKDWKGSPKPLVDIIASCGNNKQCFSTSLLKHYHPWNFPPQPFKIGPLPVQEGDEDLRGDVPYKTDLYVNGIPVREFYQYYYKTRDANWFHMNLPNDEALQLFETYNQQGKTAQYLLEETDDAFGPVPQKMQVQVVLATESNCKKTDKYPGIVAFYNQKIMKPNIRHGAFEVLNTRAYIDATAIADDRDYGIFTVLAPIFLYMGCPTPEKLKEMFGMQMSGILQIAIYYAARHKSANGNSKDALRFLIGDGTSGIVQFGNCSTKPCKTELNSPTVVESLKNQFWVAHTQHVLNHESFLQPDKDKFEREGFTDDFHTKNLGNRFLSFTMYTLIDEVCAFFSTQPEHVGDTTDVRNFTHAFKTKLNEFKADAKAQAAAEAAAAAAAAAARARAEEAAAAAAASASASAGADMMVVDSGSVVEIVTAVPFNPATDSGVVAEVAASAVEPVRIRQQRVMATPVSMPTSRSSSAGGANPGVRAPPRGANPGANPGARAPPRGAGYAQEAKGKIRTKLLTLLFADKDPQGVLVSGPSMAVYGDLRKKYIDSTKSNLLVNIPSQKTFSDEKPVKAEVVNRMVAAELAMMAFCGTSVNYTNATMKYSQFHSLKFVLEQSPMLKLTNTGKELFNAKTAELIAIDKEVAKAVSDKRKSDNSSSSANKRARV